MKYIFYTSFMMLWLLIGCTPNTNAPNDATSTAPEIISLTAEKNQILYGGQDPAIITCTAKGGNLKYVWEVDLGDIIPLNSDHSKISFNGAACCVGLKVIKCTVSNDKGSVSKTIEITILEVINPPEIISIATEQTDINVGETSNIVCNAIGGHLKYNWQLDCGNFTLNPTDSSKITYVGTSACKGIRTIKCTVSNEKGSFLDSLKINVK